MISVNKYINYRLCNHLNQIPKTNIFKVGTGGGKQISGIFNYASLSANNLLEYYDFIDYNYYFAKKYNLRVNDNFFLENREYYQSINDKPFEGKYHMDFIQESQKPCYTFIYYYRLSNSIIGGELEFEKVNIKYNPSLYDIICFDGDHKHRINKLYGEGVRGTLIMNIEKNLSIKSFNILS